MYPATTTWVDLVKTLSPGRITIEGWIYPTAVADLNPRGSAVLAKESYSPVSSMMVWRLGVTPKDHRLQFLCLTSLGRRDATSDESLAMDRWTHVAATYDGWATRLYVDGRLVRTAAAAADAPLAATPVPTVIGNVWGDFTQGFKGLLDEVTVYDYARSGEQIAADAARNRPPVADAGADQVIEQTGPDGARVALDGTASSDPDGDALTYAWSGPFGTAEGPAPVVLVPAGSWTVTLVVSDGTEVSKPAMVLITVRDTTSPRGAPPPDVAAEATGPLTPVEIGKAEASDAVGVVSLSSNAPPAFPVGVTRVVWTAADAAGNAGSAVQRVTVRDTTPPVVVAPPDIAVEATGPLTPVVIGRAAASDAVGVVSLTHDAPAQFPIGTTDVTWRAADAAGNVGMAVQRIVVRDTLPPVFLAASASPDVLWPPDHRMVQVSVQAEVADRSGRVAGWRVLGVTCNEPADALGDGRTPADVAVLDARTVLLRAERAGNGGDRIYTIRLEASDAAGNKAVTSVAVRVPQSRRP
jgi:hypothetical protein